MPDMVTGFRGPGLSRGQLVDLAERHDLAGVLPAPEDPLAPHHPHGHPSAGQIVEHDLPAAVAGGEHPAGRAPHQRRRSLHHHGERAWSAFHGPDMDVGQVEERARGRADSMRHVEAFMDQVAWSLPILEASTSTQTSPTIKVFWIVGLTPGERARSDHSSSTMSGGR